MWLPEAEAACILGLGALAGDPPSCAPLIELQARIQAQSVAPGRGEGAGNVPGGMAPAASRSLDRTMADSSMGLAALRFTNFLLATADGLGWAPSSMVVLGGGKIIESRIPEIHKEVRGAFFYNLPQSFVPASASC